MLFINYDVKIIINSNVAKSVNKIPVLLTQTQCLQGFFYVLRVKKDLAELLLQGLNLIFNFALWLINGFTHQRFLLKFLLSLIAACAAMHKRRNYTLYLLATSSAHFLAIAICSAETSSSKSQKVFSKTSLPVKVLYQIRPSAYLPRPRLA